MDSLKTLYERGEYALVEELTSAETGSLAPEEALLRVKSLLFLKREGEALSLLLGRRDELYRLDPLDFIDILFSLRFGLGQFDEAYHDEEWLQEQPYVSQKVEEELRDLKERIRAEERLAFKRRESPLSECLQILRDPNSSDMQLLLALNKIPHGEHSLDADIASLAEGERSPSVRTIALLTLISHGYKGKVTFKRYEKVYELIPAEANPPFTGDFYEAFDRELAEYHRDPSFGEAARFIYANYALAIYPEEALTVGNRDLLLAAIWKEAEGYLGTVKDLSGFMEAHGLTLEAVEGKRQEIASIIEKETAPEL